MKKSESKASKERIAGSKKESQRTLHKNLNFTASEAYKLLRTNILFSLPDEGRCRIIGVTSSIRDEGKSTTSINLANSFAETGQRVLLIDGDMRLPSVARKMQVNGAPGLSNALVGTSDTKINFVESGVNDNWLILPAGDIPPNPSELLGSKKMKDLLERLSEKFDFIIVDLPPVNIVSDASVFGRLLDGMIVVVREDYTDKHSVRECYEQLSLSGVKLLGYVLNDVKEGRQFRSKYKRYYNKYYKGYYKSYYKGDYRKRGYGYGEMKMPNPAEDGSDSK